MMCALARIFVFNTPTFVAGDSKTIFTLHQEGIYHVHKNVIEPPIFKILAICMENHPKQK
jgi:hypothetical protein